MAAIGAVFVALGIGIMTRPGGLGDGLLAVVFFGMVVAVAVTRLRIGVDRPLPWWIVLLGCAVFTVACVYLLVAMSHGGGGSSPHRTVLTVADVVGIVFFGGGGAAYAVLGFTRRNRDPQGSSDPDPRGR